MSRLMSFLTGGSSPRRRIGLTVAATGLGRIVSVGYNFFLVPILLSSWGIQVYGEWIVLSALASMATLSNVGFIQASLSEMILRISAGEQEEARRVLSTTIVGLVALVIVVFGLGVVILNMADPQWLFAAKAIPVSDARVVVELSLAGVLLSFFPGALSAPISAARGAGITQAVMTIAKLGELVSIVVIALFHGGPVAVTAMPVLSAVLTSIAFVALIRHLVPWLTISVFQFRRETFRRLLHPSLGQFLLYASTNIVAIQLPRIVLGHLGGAAVVAVYSVAVTYTRAAKMLTGVLAQSFQVEITRAYGEAKYALTTKLVETICQIGGWLTALAVCGMLIFAGPLFQLWTRGKIPADFALIAILGVATVTSAYNEGFIYLLMGINRVWAIALGHFAASIVAIAAGTILYPELGVYGLAAALCLPELVLAVVGISDTAKALQTKRTALFRQSLQLPVKIVRHEAERAASVLFRPFRS